MSDFKGTKGSWSFNKDDFSVTTKGDYKNPTEICHVMDNNPYDGIYEEDFANGHLIAAAPELLEALQALKREIVLSDVDLDYIESHFRPHIDRARAAIAKALGQ